jgi:ABC-type branched-subunit amino acid transport system substrate-binding protein
MSYCLNPHCPDRLSPPDLEQCPACQTSLTILGRYRIIQPLCERQYASTEVFRVIDISNPASPLVLKTLIHDDPKLQDLFHREQLLLMQVSHQNIPQGYDTFAVTVGEDQTLHCLVMEYIAGENLDQWVKNHGAISTGQAIEWLKQLLSTLEYIHQRKVFHRDIKPSNIMRRSDGTVVLIDFGSTRQITDTILSDRTRTTVVSFGYTAPEQLGGKAVPQSDFYALGKTLMYLLMGQDVSSPQSFIPSQPIAPSLQKLLQAMTMDAVSARPKNATIILRRLCKIEREAIRNNRRRIGLGFLAGTLCGGTAMIPLMRQIDWDRESYRFFSNQTCEPQQSNSISCGEKSLLSEAALESILGSNVAQNAEAKKAGIKYFKESNWLKAQASFQQVWENSQDPEALIYLNNSKIHLNAVQRRAAIAVVAPLNGSKSSINKGLNILRGAAMAQQQALEKGLGLQIVLIDDHNNPNDAVGLAQELVKRRGIVAVIGHHVSDATGAALKIYDQNKMVLISPTSTSQELNTYASRENNIFFRTVASDDTTAIRMADFLLRSAKLNRVAVFYNPDKSYSRSLAKAFKKNYQLLQGQIIADPNQQFHLSCTGCNKGAPFQLKQAIQYAKAQGAQAFMVLPDAMETGSNAMAEAIELIQAAGEIPIVTGDAMAGENRLLDSDITAKIVIASNWEVSQNPNSPLAKFWQPKSGQGRAIAWQTYTTYNASQVLITALQQDPSLDRSTLRQRIAANGFSAPGASGDIRFDGGELQQPQVTLTTIAPCPSAVLERCFVGIN